MLLTGCENPIKIKNKVTGLYEFVPCGRCPSCLNAHSQLLVRMMNDESKCHKFCWFVTLTYSNKFLPKFIYDDVLGLLVNPSTSECISVLDFIGYEDTKTLNYLRKRGYVCAPCVRDVQLFLKRLRYFVSDINKFVFPNEKVRYACCAEYGPTTHRIHYHLVLWFDSPFTAEKIDEIIFKSWQFGIVDSSSVKQNCSSYVAAYISSFYNLPKIYQHKSLRPFFLRSKCPSIGSLLQSDEKIFQIFYNSTPVYGIPSSDGKSFVDVPLLPYVKNRLFPKISRFSKLSHSVRVALYGLPKFIGCEEWIEFKAWYEGSIERYSSSLSLHTGIESFDYLISLVRYNLYDDNGLIASEKFKYARLKHFFSVVSRVCAQCALFGVSIELYVTLIERYYDNVARYNLYKMYLFEDWFASRYGVQSLIWLDPLFVKSLVEKYGSSIQVLPSVLLERLSSYGLDERFIYDSVFRNSLRLSLNKEYKNFVALQHKIFASNTKTKIKNEYLMLHPECKI